MPDIYMVRKIFTHNSTIGKLTFGDLELWTLEDTMRKQKVYGETCIPAGVYELELRPSDHFKRIMPFLVRVPGYEGIMIHPGNVPLDTNGCILVGKDHTVVDKIDQSRDAFDLLFPRLEEAMKNQILRIHIAGGYSAEDMST